MACATVGMLEVYPNSRNVIPGRVWMTIDFRHPDDDVLATMDAAMREAVGAICDDIGLELEIEQIFYYAPVRFEESCINAVRQGAAACDYSMREIVSGAGHDACFMAAVAPSAMIFIPCVDGISHNEVEDAKPEWVTAGCDVLLHAILDRVEEAT